MFTHENIKILPLALTAALLSACSGDSDSTTVSGGIQLYNGSYNSPYTRLVVDEVERTGADFGDVSTRHSYASGSYKVSYQYQDESDNAVEIQSADIKIRGDQKQLIVMSGDFSDPTITELSIPVTNNDDDFSLGFFNIADTGKDYDVYIVADDGLFEQAQLLQSAVRLQLTDFSTLSEDSYTLYVTEAGSSEVIFQSPEVYFNDDISYVAMIRQSFATEQHAITLDLVSDSNQVTSLKHTAATGQVHFYNAMDEYSSVSYKTTRGNETAQTDTIAADVFSGYLPLEPNSYSVSMLDESQGTVVDNYLLTLEREQSVAGIFYRDKDLGPRMLSVAENLSPSSYSHQITVVNLLDSYAGQDLAEVDVYFTLNGETVDEATNYVSNLDAYDSKTLSVDNQKYTVYVIFEDNGQQIVLFQQADLDVTAAGHYLMILEQDASSSDGYKLTLTRTVSSDAE